MTLRGISLWAIVLMLTGCVAHTSAPLSLFHTNRAAELANETVAVNTGCSGVWVAHTLILTAHHCVDEKALGDPVPYEMAEKPSIAILRQSSAEFDLALLETLLAAPPHGVAHPAAELPRPGDFVQTMGHPFGLWYSYSAGHVAAIREGNPGWMPHAITWVQATPPISPGDSGCGLFNENGELIGITSWGYTRGQNLNFFVHLSHIREFLNRSLSAPAHHPSSPRGGGGEH